MEGVDGFTFEKFRVERTESVEDIAAHVNEVVDADSLEVVGASGSAGYHKFCTAVEILEGGGSEFGIFVVA